MALLCCETPVKAGLDFFSRLDVIDGWIIERRVDSKTNEIRCRASVLRDGNWFSNRRRLDENNLLVIPDHYLNQNPINYLTINKIKLALKNCRSNLIYSAINSI